MKKEFNNQILIEKITILLKEFSEIIARFHETARKAYDIDVIFDIFEALNYELKIRTDEVTIHL
jgi:hypothetical protein